MASAKDCRIIFLSYYYPPIKSPGVKRNYTISHLFTESFKKVTVFTTSNRKVMAQDEQPISPDISLVKVPTYDYRFFSYLILKNKESAESKAKSNKAGKYFLKAMRSFPVNIFIGEGGLWYIWSAYARAKRIISKESQTIIYSSFSPYADHVVAWLLKRKFKKLIWVADFRDLHVDPTYRNYLWKKLQLWFDKTIIRKATFVTTVSEGLAQNLRKFHDDVFVLPNGVAKMPKAIERYTDKFTINYTGAMFQDKRRPHLLLKALQELIREGKIEKNTIRIQQAGRDVAIWKPLISKFNLEGVFESKGIVALDDAHLLQSKSHVNLLLTTSHKEYKGVLTSKIFEYLGAGNPILVIINGPKDEIYEEAMSGVEHVFVGYDSDSLDEIKEYILSYYNMWKTQKHYPRIKKENWAGRYYWPEMIHGLEEKIISHVE
ncbi:MAG TPA: hypothetical protein ENK85_05805 [Saprospiraceae bacterium]|nr:hypothetical protein [Saprospiraceae bacterium]